MAATLQTLPPLARRYHAAQRTDIDDALAEIAEQWRRIGPRFDTGWSLVGPYIASIVMGAQAQLVQRADSYVPAILEDTDQTRHVEAEFEPDTNALVGLTGDGYPVGESLSTATIRAKQAIAGGATTPQALDFAGSWLAQSAMTVMADTMRGAEGASRYARNVGYIRMVNGGACGRCVVQAGKWFRTNQGFLRHPRCRCVHIPASENVGTDWQTNPDDYFRSLNTEQQIKLMGGKANAQAVLDGADIGQLVNAYRRSSGMRFAQESSIRRRNGLKFTTEGTTRRATAAQQQVALRRNGPLQQRVMPETIYRRAPNRDEALRQLKLYGWIKDDAARTRGRAIFAEQRRVERNARAAARRAERRAVNPTPQTAGAAGGARPPGGNAPVPASAAPDPSDRDAFKAYWKARQDALPVDFKGEVLESHEVEFVERFLAAGRRMDWIRGAGFRPTNDFIWIDNNGLAVELKSTKAKYTTIRGRIKDAVGKARNHGMVKANFMVDLGTQPLTDELRADLARYNLDRSQYQIERLWVMSDGRIEQIVLETKE